MKTGSMRALLSFFAPGSLLLLATALLLRETHLPGSSYVVVRFGFFILAVTGILLSWRFHSARVSSLLVALVLIEEALTAQRVPGASTEITFGLLAVLIPINFFLLSVLRDTPRLLEEVRTVRKQVRRGVYTEAIAAARVGAMDIERALHSSGAPSSENDSTRKLAGAFKADAGD